MGSNTRYRGLGRSQTACTQNVSLLNEKCGNLTDAPFDQSWLPQATDRSFVRESMLTNGNWGPHGLVSKDCRYILNLNVLTLIALFLALLGLSRQQSITARFLDAKAT